MNPLPCSSPIIPNIDWKNGLITYDSNHKDYSGINTSTSNDFSTSFNSVSLVYIFAVVYLADIMVLSSSEEEHVKHVASVLQRLGDNNMLAKASKCVFHASSVEYLEYVVSSDGLKMHSSKVEKIPNWTQPNNIKALHSFLGFANFYCHFIKNSSKIISALSSLLNKDSPFIFNEEALSWFQILKEAFTTSPVLSDCHNAVCQTSKNGTISKKAIKPVERLVNTGKLYITFHHVTAPPGLEHCVPKCM
ncbi:hypothetical protein O181_036260 [Austropuccinia psidii MF-1]|uniref:Reverse transcriptase domain-containing protein n=1 Tax=Austropuccinia psidii MF-1 TaxID=1389203 RepID=A0A9Q3D679_9BASI|nr:hypothetical protein [Austropuccinia psidii MF-1]